MVEDGPPPPKQPMRLKSHRRHRLHAGYAVGAGKSKRVVTCDISTSLEIDSSVVCIYVRSDISAKPISLFI